MKRSTTIVKCLVLAGAALGLAACGQNPFPTDGKITQGQIDQPEYAMDAPTSVACVAGKSCEFDVKASVLADMGYPNIVLTDMPVGAKFNSHSGHFEWTPTLMDREPGKTVTVYALLSTSEAPKDFGMTKAIEITVAPGGFTP
ncbi:MAG: hypothetical protein JST04_09860 [Bdellovibrionales bacterium]|nr:hypothetical protein [Bdellovibrionales bacterium]